MTAVVLLENTRKTEHISHGHFVFTSVPALLSPRIPLVLRVPIVHSVGP